MLFQYSFGIGFHLFSCMHLFLLSLFFTEFIIRPRARIDKTQICTISLCNVDFYFCDFQLGSFSLLAAVALASCSTISLKYRSGISFRQ